MTAASDLLVNLPWWAGLALLLVAALVAWPILRAVAWRLFGFNRNVQEILWQKKSSEVRIGKIAEVLSPVLEDFPVDVHKPGTSTVFLGQPVDFVHFDPEEGITFIEVKSGNARLSATQRALKAHIEAGNVSWEAFRVKER